MRVNINWAILVTDLLEHKVWTQTKLGDYCKVTQQAISGWSTGTRSPDIYGRNQLRAAIAKLGWDITTYQVNQNQLTLPAMDVDLELMKVAKELMKLSEAARHRVIEKIIIEINVIRLSE